MMIVRGAVLAVLVVASAAAPAHATQPTAFFCFSFDDTSLQIAVTGWVQKVSNLILNMNVVVRDVATGQTIAAGSVDIRGNTDESWSRALAYLVHNRLQPSAW
ncbi:MAG: DUF2380 domain-containing protein [Acetobacteraceae bacterium]|nr:DUF2380 domain-containing protein [Acetobacteraceae bacterium]